MALWCRTVTTIAKKVFAFGKEYGTCMDLRCIAVEVVRIPWKMQRVDAIGGVWRWAGRRPTLRDAGSLSPPTLSQWVQATDLELFTRRAEDQLLKVCVPFHISAVSESRCSGSAVQTRVSQTKQHFCPPDILQSPSSCYRLPLIDQLPCSQFHPNDDSALSVPTYAVDAVGVELHGRCPFCASFLIRMHTLWDTPNAAERACLEVSNPPLSNVSSRHSSEPLTRWLSPFAQLLTTLDLASTPTSAHLDAVVDTSVEFQVKNLSESDVIKATWAAYANNKDEKKQVGARMGI